MLLRPTAENGAEVSDLLNECAAFWRPRPGRVSVVRAPSSRGLRCFARAWSKLCDLHSKRMFCGRAAARSSKSRNSASAVKCTPKRSADTLRDTPRVESGSSSRRRRSCGGRCSGAPTLTAGREPGSGKISGVVPAFAGDPADGRPTFAAARPRSVASAAVRARTTRTDANRRGLSARILAGSPTHTRRRHSSPGGAFTHAQGLDAIREQRRVAQFQMQHALLELHQVGEHSPRQHVALLNQL